MNKVSYIPKGYQSVTAYLIFQSANAAIDFYKKVFQAKEVMRMPKPDGRIGHAELMMGDTKIMLADEYPEMNARAPQAFGGSPISLMIYVPDVDDVIKTAVANGATLHRKPENMFYGDRIGSVVDPFGYTWSIATHVEDVSMDEMKKRAEKLFGQKSNT